MQTKSKKSKDGIPEPKRDQLGKGVRGKYFQQYIEKKCSRTKFKSNNETATENKSTCFLFFVIKNNQKIYKL